MFIFFILLQWKCFDLMLFYFSGTIQLSLFFFVYLLNFRSWCQSILPSSNRLLFYLISVKAIAVLVHSLIECWSPVNQWDCYLCIIWICLCTPGDTLCKNFVPEVQCCFLGHFCKDQSGREVHLSGSLLCRICLWFEGHKCWSSHSIPCSKLRCSLLCWL